jgi:hypothetical protein
MIDNPIECVFLLLTAAEVPEESKRARTISKWARSPEWGA